MEIIDEKREWEAKLYELAHIAGRFNDKPPRRKLKTTFDQKLHAEVGEMVRKSVNAIMQENHFAAVEVLREDLHDGRVTFRFSFTEQK